MFLNFFYITMKRNFLIFSYLQKQLGRPDLFSSQNILVIISSKFSGKYAVKCHLEQCSNEQTGHYHCSICDLIISRKDTAERHFRRCAVTDDNVTVEDHQVSEQCDYVADIDIGTGDNVAEKDDHEDDKDEHPGDEDDHVGDKDDHVGDKEDHVAEAFDEHNYWYVENQIKPVSLT